jgi:tetratricopeptide (TPR) repeat protein
MNNLGVIYSELNRHEDALKLQNETLRIMKRALPKDHPHTLACMSNLANSYAALNRHAEALNLRRETLAIQKRVLPKDHVDSIRSMVNLARSHIQLGGDAEAILLLDEAIAKARIIPAASQQLLPFAFSVRGMHYRKVGDPVGCRETAEQWEKLNRTDASSLYDAACHWAVTAAVQAKTTADDGAKLAKNDADRAMALLQKAVQAGFNDAAHIKNDADLDALRGRDDFKKVLAQLEIDAKSAPTPANSPPTKK